MGAAEVGDVEALDPDRGSVQPERLLQALERLHPRLAAALRFQPLLVEGQHGVALGELEDAPLLAALGDAHLQRPVAAAGERLAQRLAPGQLLRQHQQRRDRGPAAVVLEHELLRDLGRLALGGVLQVEGLAVAEDPVADLEHLRVGVAPVDGHGHRVEGARRGARHAPALEQRAHGLQAVALERGLLEALLGGRLQHPPLELALDVREAPGEEVDHAVDALAVLLARDVAHARGLAALDVVVEARVAAAPPGLGPGAGAEHEHLRQHLERGPHALGVGVGPEVHAVAAMALAGEVHAREVLVQRDRDERVGLVVAQADVEARPVLLDEALLGQQRLGLGGDDDALHVRHRGDHVGVAGAARDLGLGEVRGHPLAHRLGLADVQHPPRGVPEQVHPGLVGEGPALLQQAPRASSRRRGVGGGHG